MKSEDYAVVVTTTETEEEAKRIAEAILNARLAACVQILPIESIYRWEGKFEQAREYRLEIKTRFDRYAQIETLIRNLHSYEIPEILAIPVSGGSSSYLRWIDEELHQENR